MAYAQPALLELFRSIDLNTTEQQAMALWCRVVLFRACQRRKALLETRAVSVCLFFFTEVEKDKGRHCCSFVAQHLVISDGRLGFGSWFCWKAYRFFVSILPVPEKLPRDLRASPLRVSGLATPAP